MYILISILMLAVLVVLATGVVIMGAGGNINKRWGNRLMIARVTLQALVVALIAVMFVS